MANNRIDFQKLRDDIMQEVDTNFLKNNPNDETALLLLESMKILAVNAATIALQKYDEQIRKNHSPLE